MDAREEKKCHSLYFLGEGVCVCVCVCVHSVCVYTPCVCVCVCVHSMVSHICEFSSPHLKVLFSLALSRWAWPNTMCLHLNAAWFSLLQSLCQNSGKILNNVSLWKMLPQRNLTAHAGDRKAREVKDGTWPDSKFEINWGVRCWR